MPQAQPCGIRFNTKPLSALLFSIITITYNAGHTLAPTLESVSGQTCRDYEHIIVDGASTDDTLSIASDHTPDPRRRIVSEPDKGLYDAMNKGLRMARGEYVLFLNAGDSFADNGILQRYADAAREHDADIVYCDTMLVDAERRIVAPRHLSVPERLTFRSFAKGMLVCHQAFCVRRTLTGPYDLSYRFSADYEWCLRCLRNSDPARCVNLHTPGIHYLTDGLTDRNRRASLKERYRIMCRYYGTVPTVLRHVGFLVRDLMRKCKRI